MATLRQSQVVTDKATLDMLFSLKEEDITSSFIYSTFGEFDGKETLRPYDVLKVPANTYGPEGHKNKNAFTTTVGIWVYNKWFIEKDLFNLFHYINSSVTGKMLKKIQQRLIYALMEDEIPLEVYKAYLIKTQLIMPYVTILAPNHSELILTCTQAIDKKKKELLEKYKDKLEAGDVHTAEIVEKELLDFAINYVGEDPSMDTFLSDARGTIENNFKNMYVVKGMVRDPDPNAKQEYHFATSNFMDGVKPEEYALYCNSAAAGPYSRGKKTEFGGYMENLFTRAFQDVVLDEPGTDCGTKRTITVTLNDDNFKRYIYNYIVSGSSLVELTYKNKDKYIGKTVHMRFAALCEHEKICSKCAGNMYYRVGVRNVGLTLMQVPSAFKNKAMKA